MTKKEDTTHLIPTRRQRSKLQIALIAQHTADLMLGNWGLTTALAISTELQRLLKAEKKRRKGLEK